MPAPSPLDALANHITMVLFPPEAFHWSFVDIRDCLLFYFLLNVSFNDIAAQPNYLSPPRHHLWAHIPHHSPAFLTNDSLTDHLAAVMGECTSACLFTVTLPQGHTSDHTHTHAQPHIFIELCAVNRLETSVDGETFHWHWQWWLLCMLFDIKNSQGCFFLFFFLSFKLL